MAAMIRMYGWVGGRVCGWVGVSGPLLVLDTKSQGRLLRVCLKQLANAHCGIRARTQGKRNAKRLPVFFSPIVFCMLMVAYMLDREVRKSKYANPRSSGNQNSLQAATLKCRSWYSRN